MKQLAGRSSPFDGRRPGASLRTRAPRSLLLGLLLFRLHA